MAKEIQYHISPKTGRAGQCTATVRGCQFAKDGKLPEHYETKADAQKAAEKILSKEHGSTSTLTKTKKAPVKKSSFEMPSRIETNGYTQNAWVGSRRNEYEANKENEYLSANIVAKKIREDVKNAVKAGELPSSLKYSITTDKYAGGFAIRTKVSGMGDLYDISEYTERRQGLELKPEHQKVLDTLDTISDGWNYRDSDGSIDYFNSGFYGNAKESLPAEEAYFDYEKSRKSFNKALTEKKDNPEDAQINSKVAEAEKDYFEKLGKYTKENETERGIYDTAYDQKRMPNEKEYAKIKEVAELKAKVRVMESKEKYSALNEKTKV